MEKGYQLETGVSIYTEGKNSIFRKFWDKQTKMTK